MMKALEYYRQQYKSWLDIRGCLYPNDLYGKGKEPFICPRAKCKDGFEISIQASYYHYSAPREAGRDFYTAYELGYPSEDDPLIEPFREWSDPEYSSEKSKVYPYVSEDIVEELVTKHGGIVGRA